MVIGLRQRVQNIKLNRESLVMSECSTLAQDFTSWPESPEAKLTLCWAGAQKEEASTHTQADGGGRDQTAPRMVMLQWICSQEGQKTSCLQRDAGRKWPQHHWEVPEWLLYGLALRTYVKPQSGLLGTMGRIEVRYCIHQQKEGVGKDPNER